jgi:hypothetical protein
MSDGAGYDCDACPRYRGACEALRLHEQRIAELEIALAHAQRERASAVDDLTVAMMRARRQRLNG